MRSNFISMSIFLICSFLSLGAEDKIYTATNAEWSVTQDKNIEVYPLHAVWQVKKSEGPFFVPDYTGQSPKLKNFFVQKMAFPEALEVAIGPPAEGLYRFEEKSLSLFLEHIGENGYGTDNNLEYQFSLEGQWGINSNFTNDQHLYEFITGENNWLEVVVNDRLLSSGRGKVVISGADFPKKGEGFVKVSAIDKDNKGLLGVRCYGVYEELVPDPFHLALSEKWHEKSKSLKWLKATDKNIRVSPWKPEDTPALYRRIFICENEASTQNIHFSTTESIQAMWINGQLVDLNNSSLSSGLLKVGENEVLFYLPMSKRGLEKNFELYSISPQWIKTTVQGNDKSILGGLLRGARAAVYINGRYAGVLNEEKVDEYLGYGLFKEGANEIALAIMQNHPNVFLEYIKVTEAKENMSILLPWFKNEKPILTNSPGRISAYDGFYLQWQDSEGRFSSNFYGKFSQDTELLFLSGKRFPKWMFKSELTIPNKINFNGEEILREGNSFILPARLSKDVNKVSFSHRYGGLPEPIFYLNAAPKKSDIPVIRKLSRTGQERLKPGIYFTGEKVSYFIDADYTNIQELNVSLGEQTYKLGKDSSREITFDLQQEGEFNLKFEFIKNGKKSIVNGDVFKVLKFPEDKTKWLMENKFCEEIVITQNAFFNSESMLFPEFHQQEWFHREVNSDKGSLEFGAFSSINTKQKFSLFDSFPNGTPVFEKFARRLETYMKLRSQGFPVIYRLETEIENIKLWESAAVIFHYLNWLESKNIKIDWSLETLGDYKSKYVDGLQAEADEYLKFRQKSINSIIQKMGLLAAPGSIFKEIKK